MTCVYKRMFFRQSKFEANWEKTAVGGPEACSPGKFLKFYMM